jgi:hypothetical protein
MARIPSYGQIISGQCGFNQATSHPADPIKRHRARRERSHPKVVLTAQTNAVALDLLENDIHDAREIIGEYVQGHLGRNLRQALRQKMRRAHPHLERAEGMLSRLAA